MPVRVLNGDCRDVLRTLPAASVQCCVTSPPYWGLRDYGVEATVWGGDTECDHEWGDLIQVNATNHTDKRRWNHTRKGRDEEQPIEKRVAWLRTKVPQGKFCQHCGAWAGALGLEPNPDLFVDHIVEVFREVRRVLRPDGTLWLNLGDSYATGAGKVGERPGGGTQGDAWKGHRGSRGNSEKQPHTGSAVGPMTQPNRLPQAGLKPKDLCGIPWRVAFALQADGWWLRQDIIWSKPNPMPESVTDRCTKAHEYLFLLSKSERYHYDALAIAEPLGLASISRLKQNIDQQRGSDRVPGKTNGMMKAVGRRAAGNKTHKGVTAYESGDERLRTKAGLVAFAEREREKVDAGDLEGSRNRRSVWTVATQPFSEAHFATFPPRLAELCILAGSASGDTILDPFGGSGTVGMVADRLRRSAVLIDLNPEYTEMAARRFRKDAGMFAEIATS